MNITMTIFFGDLIDFMGFYGDFMGTHGIFHGMELSCKQVFAAHHTVDGPTKSESAVTG